MDKSEKYYVVKRGFKKGIFKTWGECFNQINKYKFPIYKKFDNLKDAEEFLNNDKKDNKKDDNSNELDSNKLDNNKLDSNKLDSNIENTEEKEEKEYYNFDCNYIFCDGSAVSSSYKVVKSGFGVYIVKSNGETIEYNQNIGIEGTNNIAELSAILYALEFIEKSVNGLYCIISDSKYAINCITVWSKKWKLNDWKSGNKTIENVELIRDIVYKYDTLLKKKYIIEFKHVNSHKKPPNDISSFEYFVWFGNEMADQLAKGGIIKKYDNPSVIFSP